MDSESIGDLSKLIVQSVKALSKTSGVTDKNREDAFKFMNSIISLGFKFPGNLLKTVYEIVIGVNMDENLHEFIIEYAVDTLSKLIELDWTPITDSNDRRIFLAFIDRLKYFIRNCDKYSKSLIESFLKVMFKLVYLLDYDSLGIIFPFLSVITIKWLILVIPSANGMMQSYLTQIWQVSLTKVFGDGSSLVK